MSTSVKDPAEWTADEIVAVIPHVLDDPPALNALLRLLAVRDPRKAQAVLDTIEVALTISGSGSSDGDL